MKKRRLGSISHTYFEKKTDDAKWCESEYQLELLTPMAGGGVESWRQDDKFPVRCQSIKGHLRFWWRAMQSMSDLEELRKRENEIWGATERASTVSLQVSYPDEEKRCTRIKYSKKDNPQYVFFPFQSVNDPTIITELSFILQVRCLSKYAKEVKKAIQLWVLFGGLGARTRRGCGSLFCQSLMKELNNPTDIDKLLKSISCNHEAAHLSEAKFPQIHNCLFAYQKAGNGSPTKLWGSFLQGYGEFRQARNHRKGRNGRKRLGRSYWPEADTIRRITKTFSKHPPVKENDRWFPRAAYGLPIQFKFGDGCGDPVGGVGKDKNGAFMLQPGRSGHDRWPSPVILKIIRLGNGELIKACLVLNCKVPSPLVLEGTEAGQYELDQSELPMATAGKSISSKCPIDKCGNKSPYYSLINYLGLKEAHCK